MPFQFICHVCGANEIEAIGTATVSFKVRATKPEGAELVSPEVYDFKIIRLACAECSKTLVDGANMRIQGLSELHECPDVHFSALKTLLPEEPTPCEIKTCTYLNEGICPNPRAGREDCHAKCFGWSPQRIRKYLSLEGA